MEMAVHALLLGGGMGTRMKNSVNKSFIPLNGKPIIVYSLQLFQQHPEITGIIIIMHKDWVAETMKWVNQLGITKVKQMVEGGSERQYSVRNGVQALASGNAKPGDMVLVHNSANPLITPVQISECIRAAQQHRASVAGYRVKDTIRRAHPDGTSIETLKRDELWGMQTPQCIEYGLFVEAHTRAHQEGFLGTDDVQLVERMGVPPRIVDCGYENIKITTPEDVPIAEAILARRKKNAGETENTRA